MKRKPPSLDKPYRKHRALLPHEVQAWRETMGEKPEIDTLPLPPGEEDFASVAQPSLINSVKERATGPSPIPLPEGEGFKSGFNRVAKKNVKQSIPLSIDKSAFAKISRGKQRPQATLDLHGHTRVTAYTAVARFIEGAQARGNSLVIVITGKGKTGGGALRELLPDWLDLSPLREAVISFSPAGPRHGGDGAWYVRIRKRRG